MVELSVECGTKSFLKHIRAKPNLNHLAPYTVMLQMCMSPEVLLATCPSPTAATTTAHLHSNLAKQTHVPFQHFS